MYVDFTKFLQNSSVARVAPLSLTDVRCTVRQRQVKLSALDLARFRRALR
jgi:hypothetical protein